MSRDIELIQSFNPNLLVMWRTLGGLVCFRNKINGAILVLKLK